MSKTTKRDHLEKPMNVGILAAKILDLSNHKSKSKPNYERLNIILEEIRSTHEKQRSLFAEYCKAAIEEGFTAKETWEYMRDKLRDIIPKSTLYRWAEKELPLKAKNITKPRNDAQESSEEIPMWESFESERSSSEEQQPAQNRQVNLSVGGLGFDIEHLEDYSIEFLRNIVRFLHYRKVMMEMTTNGNRDKTIVQHT